MPENDIVADIIQRLADSLGADVCPPDLMFKIEAEVRRDWAGDVYVASSKTKHRNAKIIQQWQEGSRTVSQLSGVYGLTERRIRQIINRRKK